MRWIMLVGLLLKELVLGALRVAWLAMRPRLELRPALVAYPLVVTSDTQITLLANMITLTPGTLSVDVSPDRKTLFIHALDAPDAETLIGSIAAGFETRVLAVLK